MSKDSGSALRRPWLISKYGPRPIPKLIYFCEIIIIPHNGSALENVAETGAQLQSGVV